MNPGPLHWALGVLPLDHQGSPRSLHFFEALLPSCQAGVTAPLLRAGLRITLSKAWHQLCHTSRAPVEELAALRMLFLTRQEDPDTPMEVRAILLPATRVPASRARVRRGQADSGSWPSKVEASRRHLRRGGVHAREADGRFKRSELREPGWEGGWTGRRPGRQVQTRAASWASTTLIPGVYFSVGLPPGLVGPWRAGTCLGFTPAPDHGV